MPSYVNGEGVADMERIRHRAKLAAKKPDGKPWPKASQVQDRWRPETEEEWEGRARMAAARRDSEGVLDDVDLQALARYPDPPRCGHQDAHRAAS